MKREAHAVETSKEFSNIITGKPLSDGDWCSWHKKWAIVDPNHGGVLKPLAGIMSGELPNALNPLVAARNRYAHSPYDHRVFLKALETNLPKAIKLLRSSLSSCRILIPRSLSSEENSRVVVAQMLMGFESEPRTERMVVQAPFELFPTGSLICCEKNGSNPFTLDSYFRTHATESGTVDIGVFDRAKDGKFQFVFVNGSGPPGEE